MLPLLRVLNYVVENAAIFVKLEFEQSSELLVRSIRACDNACNLVNNVTDLSVILLAARLPFDNQSLVAHVTRRR